MTPEEEDWFDEMCKKHGAKNFWKKKKKPKAAAKKEKEAKVKTKAKTKNTK